MLAAILKGVTGIFALLAIWFAVQSYLRGRMQKEPGFDVLDDMTHGCGNCGHGGSCGGGRQCEELSLTGRQS